MKNSLMNINEVEENMNFIIDSDQLNSYSAWYQHAAKAAAHAASAL